jgi:hypothetical protein
MQDLLRNLKIQYPELRFTVGQQFCWSPETLEIYYIQNGNGAHATWSLLHETGHALLEHSTYKSDFELLSLEVCAWEKAQQLAQSTQIQIDEDHIQDCLDTYRDWLYKRSICPKCLTKCLQQDRQNYYRCFNCHTVWRVSASRFCRAYRSTKNFNPSNILFSEYI